MSKDKKVMKPVYFNSANAREKEMLEWLDGKFSSFGGMVKDLLYQEMLREKHGISVHKIEVTKEVKEQNIINEYVEAAEVEDLDC